MSESADKPKIIVDGDWKSQVEAEKEALRQQEEDSPEKAGAPASDAEMELPPASFPMLVSMLATQAMAALGQLPDPNQNEPVIQLELARHHIDTLTVLEEKTKGNLTDEESKMLQDVTYQLQMAYVAAKSAPA